MEVMRHVRLFRMILAIGLVALGGIEIGCSGPKVETKLSKELSRYAIRSIAFIPFTSIATPQAPDQGELYLPTPDSVRRSDISLVIPPNTQPPSRQTMVVPGYAAEKVTELFWGRLQDRKGVRVLSPADSARASLGNGALAGMRPENAAAEVAKRLKADAALIGLVSVYQERVGSRLGANPPATVGFDVKVVAADGQVLWAGGYYERQRPMTEDLMGFLQRWAFVTAEELAEYGVDEILKEFPFGAGEHK
ncbi:MAG: hypothetical protein NDI90_05175 [Nitrospira sp. BO4]|jgi:hypothetical protein|nr:hypothetical protein [Nitrospira sp. BO4]